ncbi:C2 calcium-dependent domain-containing protein 4C-like [Microcaecilia unicolor]|uniref:C2 calcium-dependent domain-containing protein 4C-like n=1 Tax=Microcaecilia unicolor TaxID=1415580 RepID=A0A6P7X5S7_9AMPH|nr:C2 calcium-dependent domain-containing protein 4C-like [Microcaecilia unicolor]
MWLIEKIRETVESSFSSEDQRSPVKDDNSSMKEKITRLPNNVLTPDTIPDFFIPPTFSSSSVNWKKKLTVAQKLPLLHNVSKSFAKIPLANVEHLYKKNGNEVTRLSNCHVIQIEGAEDIYIEEMSKNKCLQDKNYLSDLPSLSLQQGRDCYGIISFQGSPHTRRKESLFHVDVMNILQQRQGLLSKTCLNSTSVQPCFLGPPELSNIYKMSANEGIADGESLTSTDSFPFNSPLLPRSLSRSSLFKLFAQGNTLDEVATPVSKQFLRRKYYSADEWNSSENSPGSSINTNVTDFLSPAAFSFDFLQCQERQQKEHIVHLDRRGIVRLSAEYDSCNTTLRVRVIAAQDLYDKSFKAKNVNCHVVMYLIPGKVQRQKSTIIKNSKNPIFNEDFFFDAVLTDDLKAMSLKIKVVNSGISIKMKSVLGSKIVLLAELMPS